MSHAITLRRVYAVIVMLLNVMARARKMPLYLALRCRQLRRAHEHCRHCCRYRSYAIDCQSVRCHECYAKKMAVLSSGSHGADIVCVSYTCLEI